MLQYRLLLLQFLLNNWQPVPSIVLWNVDVESSNTLWWAFVLTHVVAWTIIYGGTVILDLAELLGVKQVCCTDCKQSVNTSIFI